MEPRNERNCFFFLSFYLWVDNSVSTLAQPHSAKESVSRVGLGGVAGSLGRKTKMGWSVQRECGLAHILLLPPKSDKGLGGAVLEPLDSVGAASQ